MVRKMLLHQTDYNYPEIFLFSYYNLCNYHFPMFKLFILTILYNICKVTFTHCICINNVRQCHHKMQANTVCYVLFIYFLFLCIYALSLPGPLVFAFTNELEQRNYDTIFIINHYHQESYLSFIAFSSRGWRKLGVFASTSWAQYPLLLLRISF